MLLNLIGEMKKAKITQSDLAELLKKSKNIICLKINGKSDFKASEIFLIKDTFFPELSLEYLFAKK